MLSVSRSISCLARSARPCIQLTSSNTNQTVFCLRANTSRHQFIRNFNKSRPDAEQQRPSLVAPVLFTCTVGCVTHILYKRYALSPAQVREYSVRWRQSKQRGAQESLLDRWRNLAPGNKLAYTIIAINIGVFLAWKVPALQSFCTKYLLSDIYGKAPVISMFGSIFSHYSFLHLFINMYILNSVSWIVDPYKFAQIYLTGGVAAGCASYTLTVLNPARMGVRSLGASGAILSLMGYVMTAFPKTKYSIMLINEIYPHSISAADAFKFILCFEMAGLIFGWKLMDHAAHLGGFLTGWLMAKVVHNAQPTSKPTPPKS